MMRRRSRLAIVAMPAIALLVIAGCTEEQRRDLGEQDVIEVLQDKIRDEVGDEDLGLECSADLDTAGTVTATCTGTTADGEDVSGEFDGTANIDDDKCTATLSITIAGEDVVSDPGTRCLA